MPERPSPQIALVSMDDGKILQTVPQPGGIYVTAGTGSHAMGFALGARQVWTTALGLTALYNVAPTQR
jgi:hypothetical protein